MMTYGLTYLLDGDTFLSGIGLPLTDRGFRYGMSVFETIAIREAAPLLLEPHLARLAESAVAAKFHPPSNWMEPTRILLEQSPIHEGVVRVYLTAGDRDGDISRVAVLFEEISIPMDLTYTRAVTVEFTPAVPFGKTGNYWPHFLAQPTNEEAILCTPQGVLLGGAMSNIFLIHEGTMLTPQQPIRRGIVRDWISAEEAMLTREDLARANAAFFTNSRFGIRELTSIDGRELPGDELLGIIWRRYRQEVLRAS